MKVAMIMGSNSDWPKLESAEKVFQEFGIDLEVTVASAHRTPELVKAFAEGARDRGVDVIISAFIRTNCWFALFACLNQVYAGVLRGIGDARAPMVIMLFSFVFFRQIYLFIVSHIQNEPHLMAFGYPLGWMMCSFLLYLYYQKSGWEKRFA